MNGKVARRQRALRRSQDNNRLGRKAASVERDAHEREFDRLMSEARKTRADAVKDANDAFELAQRLAGEKRKQAIQHAESSYIAKRDEIVKRLTRERKTAA